LAARVPNLQTGAFVLDKRLPVAAGIGGGSADAAAALRLLARVNGLAPDDARLFDAARATGADVPVCLASRPCRMRGIGDVLEPLLIPRLPCVLVNPGVAVATRDVFAALGLEPGEQREDAIVPATPSDAPLSCVVLGAQGNDLEAPAVRVQPVIAEALAALRATKGCRLARMSGSGATCVGLYTDGRAALAAAHALRRAHSAWWVRATVLG
jgi:4-diphosphocytidyl-2-C-methyl-D-erythritol kinase